MKGGEKVSNIDANFKIQDIPKRDFSKDKLGGNREGDKFTDFKNTLNSSLRKKENSSDSSKEVKSSWESKLDNKIDKESSKDVEVIGENEDKVKEESKNSDLLNILQTILASLGYEEPVDFKNNENLNLDEKINMLKEVLIDIKTTDAYGNKENLSTIIASIKEGLGKSDISLEEIKNFSKELERFNMLEVNGLEKDHETKNSIKSPLEEIKKSFYGKSEEEKPLDTMDSLKVYKPLNTDSSKIERNLSKEERILKSIIGDMEKDSSIKPFGDKDTNNKIEGEKSSLALGNINVTNVVEGENIEGISKEININSTTFTKDVVKSIKYMEVNNIKELTLKINPKELGEVIIKLSMEGNIMRARIMANHKDTYNVLNSNLNDIKQSLVAQDFKVQEISVNIYFSDATTYGEFQGRDGNQGEYREGNEMSSRDGALDDAVEEGLEEEIYKDSNINMLA